MNPSLAKNKNVAVNKDIGGWSCPECGENNMISGRYCRRCGLENTNIPNNTKNIYPKNQYQKWIIILIVIIGGCLICWYGWSLIKQKREAFNYLIDESRNFSRTIALVNSLSTENHVIIKTNENNEIFLKKLEEEENRSEETLQEISVSKEKNEQIVPNKRISGLDSILKQYYQDSKDEINTYNQYISYEYNIEKKRSTASKELEKLQIIFRNPSSTEELVAAFKSAKKVYEDFLNDLKNINPPAGMEDVHEKNIAFIEKFVTALDSMVVAFEKEDAAELDKGMKMLDQIISGEDVDEINQLKEYQFEELHKKFIDLRGRADNVKTEFIKSGAEMKAEISNINIEGW